MPTKPGKIGRRAVLGGGLAAPLLSRRAGAQDPGVLRIGVINDQTGPYADLAGPGSALAARMAAEDFGGSVLGRRIEVRVAGHQNKPDVGVALTREWLGPGGVSMIVGFSNSSISLAVQSVARELNKLVMHVSSTSSAISGSGCSPNGIQWAQTTYTDASGLFHPLLDSGKQSYFFITVDYVFGLSIEADATRVIQGGGGKVLGAVRHPLGTTDFGAYLATAGASKAQVVVIASSGNDSVLAIKQASEFGIPQSQLVVAPIAYLTDIHSIGLKDAQGLEFVQSWYWDSNDAARAWAKRFFKQIGRMPTDLQAAAYSATLHYLKGVKQAGTTDTHAVVAAMKAIPVNDMYTQNGRIQANNEMVFDVFLMRVKSPRQSRYPWDYLETVATIPSAVAFPSPAASGCPLVAKGM